MNYNEDERQNYMEISNSGKGHQSRERPGLIPVTSLIINEAEVSKDETVTYQGIPLSDITAVGYIVDYKEFEKKSKNIFIRFHWFDRYPFFKQKWSWRHFWL